MKLRPLATAVTISATMIGLLSGCSAAPTAPTAGPPVTATVTATPAAAPVAQTAADPVSALEAWALCAGVAGETARTVAPDALVVPLADADVPELVTWESDQQYFNVQVKLEPSGDFDFLAVLCHVGGTLGQPTMESTLKTH